ncbi:hypothetical protein GMA11_07115 [Granulicatella sp. zg-ZJ]|uniref:hypothetical protein n=1 Tax=Granulicatella sp. zg-ZJ TaxID=2678504 RepID=UPI0013D5A2E8|nr:hypothetical protein [Granulicatella sp. zg-ZJ]NEW62312.1 hypothetical protein [Granulicatella sp. zg-ZJ]NEW63162.1 hypothetical protein [Granulicatella sp. zg-ZJ]
MSVIRIETDNKSVQKVETKCIEVELLKEYDAYLSLKIVEKLYESQLITAEEKQQLNNKIIEHFTPYYLSII